MLALRCSLGSGSRDCSRCRVTANWSNFGARSSGCGAAGCAETLPSFCARDGATQSIAATRSRRRAGRDDLPRRPRVARQPAAQRHRQAPAAANAAARAHPRDLGRAPRPSGAADGSCVVGCLEVIRRRSSRGDIAAASTDVSLRANATRRAARYHTGRDDAVGAALDEAKASALVDRAGAAPTYRGRVVILPVGPRFAMSFKRTMPEVRRCQNYRKKSSSLLVSSRLGTSTPFGATAATFYCCSSSRTGATSCLPFWRTTRRTPRSRGRAAPARRFRGDESRRGDSVETRRGDAAAATWR